MQFTPFLTLLAEIEDPRRAEGKLYRLPHVVSLLVPEYPSFIDVHFVRLRKFFRLKWRRTPAYTTIRNILRQLNPASVEQAFRHHAAILDDQSTPPGQRHIAVDGKALRQSFEAFQDRKAAYSQRVCIGLDFGTGASRPR